MANISSRFCNTHGEQMTFSERVSKSDIVVFGPDALGVIILFLSFYITDYYPKTKGPIMEVAFVVTLAILTCLAIPLLLVVYILGLATTYWK